LFTFARDAELRFGSLRMRIEEATRSAVGDRRIVIEVALRHPGAAKVSTSEPARGIGGDYEIWVSDGETVRTYAAAHRLGTRRPVRPRVAGLEDDDLPGASRVYQPFTPLPMETLPETFIHPGNFCQNVLATGRCEVVGLDRVADREAIVVTCDHPRTVERVADRPDFRMEVAFDRETGVIVRLVESIGGEVTRHAEVTVLQPDAPLTASTSAPASTSRREIPNARPATDEWSGWTAIALRDATSGSAPASRSSSAAGSAPKNAARWSAV
jgi:hypothetical protein